MAVLKAEKRDGKGKYASFGLRKAGRIPGIIYGKGMPENDAVSLNLKEFALFLKTGGRIVDLDVSGSVRKVIVKAIQHGTYEHEILHADFRAIHENETLDVEVPIILVGEAPGVAVGGMLETSLHQVMVRCLPKDLPDGISVDVGAMQLGDIVYAQQLPVIPGVAYIVHGNPAVVSCRHPSRVEEASTEAAEGDAAAPASPEVIGEKEREAKAKEKETDKK